MNTLDIMDLRILSELRENCRQTHETIGSKLDLHSYTVSGRIKKLEKDKLIKGYSVHIDYDEVGFPFSQVVRIRLKNACAGYYECVGDIVSIPEVQTLGSLAGPYDFFALVKAKDSDHFIELMQQIASNKKILATTSDTILKTCMDAEEFNPLPRLFSRECPKKKQREKKPGKKKPLTDLDFRILRELRSDGRKPFSELSRILEVSTATVKCRIQRMEQNGVIRGYPANIDFHKIGYRMHALVGIRVEKDRIGDREISNKIMALPEVESLYRTAGMFDMNATIQLRNMEQAVEFIQSIGGISGIDKTDTAFSFEIFKSMCDFNPLGSKKPDFFAKSKNPENCSNPSTL